MLLEHPANFFFLVYLSVIRRFTAAAVYSFHRKNRLYFLESNGNFLQKNLSYMYTMM